MIWWAMRGMRAGLEHDLVGNAWNACRTRASFGEKCVDCVDAPLGQESFFCADNSTVLLINRSVIHYNYDGYIYKIVGAGR